MADSSIGSGKPKNRFPDWVGPFKGFMMSFQHEINDMFCVTVPVTSLQTFEPMLLAPGTQTAYPKRWRHGYQVQQDLVTKAGAQKLARGTGNLKIHRDTYISRL